LIRLSASRKGEIEKLIMVVSDRRDDWWATPKNAKAEQLRVTQMNRSSRIDAIPAPTRECVRFE